MQTRRRAFRPPAVVAALCLALAALAPRGADADTLMSLRPQTQLPYSWGDYGAGLNISDITVKNYYTTAGALGGPIYVTNTHILDNDPDPKEPPVEDIGIATFQYILWSGTKGGGAAINRYGAAFMGGFQLTDLDDESLSWSFLQIYTDATHPGGIIDGGGFRGKVNGDIPAYNQNPGWNFDGARTQYDYFDVPSDPSTAAAETVAFETALVCYMGNMVLVRGDWTWSFTTDGKGGLTGQSVASQAAASDTLLGLYRAANPGVMYDNIGMGTCHVPELDPGCGVTAVTLLGLGAVVWGRRKSLGV